VVRLQVPAHATGVPGHSESMQQLAIRMQAPLQILKPPAHWALHTPAPVQVKFPPHATGPGMLQVPPAQVPGPIRFPTEHVAAVHPLVVG